MDDSESFVQRQDRCEEVSGGVSKGHGKDVDGCIGQRGTYGGNNGAELNISIHVDYVTSIGEVN